MKEHYLNKFYKLPLNLVIHITLTSILGFIVLYSASDSKFHPFLCKQIINFSIFALLSTLIAIIDLKIIFNISYFFYMIVLILLFCVPTFGSVSMGAKRWINLGIIQLQPSELTKLAIVMMLARYFHTLNKIREYKISKLLLPLLGIAIPVTIIIIQPDLGTGFITIIISVITLFIAIVNIKQFLIIMFSISTCLPFLWFFMLDYQRQRIFTFLNPYKEHLGAGYNIIQSKIAIGSGGLLGKGFRCGTQSRLNFLPEHKTDFIFSVLSEEFGFVGGMTLLILYCSIILLSIKIILKCRSIFGKLAGIGIISIFCSHIFINIAMVMGLIPVVGVPLPFISYGGTMMASMLIGFGVIMNIHIHKSSNI